MKNRTKGGLMLVVLFSFFVFLICLGVNSFVPAFVVFGVIILFFYVLKAGELIDSED